jgi:hypothetical protein
MTSEIASKTRIPSSPHSPALIGSSPVTEVIHGQSLQGPANVMQSLQRQQTQPATAPVLSPSRAITSDADLDELLSKTLEIFTASTTSSSSIQSTAAPVLSPSPAITSDADLDKMLSKTLESFTPNSTSSSSPVQPAAAPSLGPDGLEPFNLEEFLALMISLAFEDIASAFIKNSAERIALFGQDANTAIGMVNHHFKSLLEHADNPGPWLKQQSQTPAYLRCRPFAASSHLLRYIDRAASIQSHLNLELVAEWKRNYQRCIALLKRHGLDRYNETEFPFSPKYKSASEQAKKLSNLSTQEREKYRLYLESFAKNPAWKAQVKKAMHDSGVDPDVQAFFNTHVYKN